MPTPVSIRPSEMVEGGVVPVDRNMTVKEARFALFNYVNKAGETVATTTAARLTLAEDDGSEHVQHYSAADPARFLPSQDGKELIPVGADPSLNKSSNFYVLMSNLISAGFPENRLSADISVLDGLYAFWIGIPEPKRPGLARTSDPEGRVRVIAVPSQIHNLPWEKAKAASGAKAAPGAGGKSGEGVNGKAVEFIGKVVDEVGSITRQQLAVRVFKDLAKNPDRDAIATALFSPEIQAALIGAGFVVDGETITRAG